MEPRMDYGKASPEAVRAMYGLEGFVRRSGIDHALLHLVKMRASQTNGCAFCIDMHSKDARAVDETEQRLYALDAWRETPFYTPRERAALAWTEALTDVRDGHVPDAVYPGEPDDGGRGHQRLEPHHRIAIAFRAVPAATSRVFRARTWRRRVRQERSEPDLTRCAGSCMIDANHSPHASL